AIVDLLRRPRIAALMEIQIPRDREQIAFDGCQVQPRSRMPRADKRLRHEIVGTGRIPREEQREPVDVPRVRAIERRERDMVGAAHCLTTLYIHAGGGSYTGR